MRCLRSHGPLTFLGFAWGGDGTRYSLGANDQLTVREAQLVTKSKDKGFPQALLKLEIKKADESWMPQDVYLVPKWEELL